MAQPGKQAAENVKDALQRVDQVNNGTVPSPRSRTLHVLTVHLLQNAWSSVEKTGTDHVQSGDQGVLTSGGRQLVEGLVVAQVAGARFGFRAR
jgi:hypothetical protein